MNKIHLYFRSPPQKDRYFPGDRYIISLAKRILRKKKIGGVEKVFINLCKGFDELNIDYDINLPFKKIQPTEPVVVLGLGKFALAGYKQPNPIIAGIGLMTHPSEWPNLLQEFPVVKYLQHSGWAKNVYVPYYGAEVCETWPTGIDTKKWAPDTNIEKKYDLLIYNKIRWNNAQMDTELRLPILKKLDDLGITWHEIVYGDYTESEYNKALQQSKGMIFLCEHESQGIACCEALSSNIPIFAWDQGYCLDPNRFTWNDPIMPATSVPFFDDRCGLKFKDLNEFNLQIHDFFKKIEDSYFKPRKYILENLTLKISAQKMLEIINNVYHN